MSTTKPEVKVEDVMSRPVITVGETEKIVNAAQLMKKHDIGSVIVVDTKGKPVGMISERDLTRRVIAKDLTPSKVTAKMAMSKPLRAIGPVASVTEAAKVMRQLKLRRLAVMDKGKLLGIITSNDIVDITPSLIDVLEEKSRIGPIRPEREEQLLSGYCEKCSEWTEELHSFEGTFVCDNCLSDLKEASEDFE